MFCSQKLGPFFPALVPLQSLNLRAALFRCLTELKKNGVLGKEIIVRKTFFEDCKGERIQELLVSFSTLVLRKILAAGHDGRACIAARLATAKSVTANEQKSFLPLAIAHRASLTAILRKKKDLRERYKDFGHTLDTKEQELDCRFEAVISTQDLLNKNPIPDHTVARVSKILEQNWQGDRKPLEVIAEGEGYAMKDTLMDTPFSEIWPQVSAGTFDGAKSTQWQGLLQDLEKRVANQEARLTDWRNFKEAMKRDDKDTFAATNPNLTTKQDQNKDPNSQKQRDFVFSPRKSPRKSDWKVGEGLNGTSPSRPKQSRQENTQDEVKERLLVFSPRKSPRKSMWPVEDPEAITSPTHSPATPQHNEIEDVAARNGLFDAITESPRQVQVLGAEAEDTAGLSSPLSSVDDTDGSSFSEISDGQLHLGEQLDHTVGTDRRSPTRYLDHVEAPSTPINEKGDPEKMENSSNDLPRPSDHSHTLFVTGSNPATYDDDDSWISSLPGEDKHEDKIESQSPKEDDILAEQVVSLTINSVPTPAKSKATLMERTRQSMAFASPVGLHNLLPEAPSPTPLPRIPSKTSHPITDTSNPKTLLERTRQSISLASSAKPKGSRKSMLDRRSSRLYPTNQFETPKRQLERVTESTPPEELFSPGAGYDSVFKSRPKIALSPNPSPRAGDDSERDGAEGERRGEGGC